MMILCVNIFKANALFTFELLVAAVLLLVLAYVTRHNLGRWFRYLSIGLLVFQALLILCTLANLCWVGRCGRDAYREECHKSSSWSCGGTIEGCRHENTSFRHGSKGHTCSHKCMNHMNKEGMMEQEVEHGTSAAPDTAASR